MQVREKFPEAVLVFVLPPSFRELECRLPGRGTCVLASLRATSSFA